MKMDDIVFNLMQLISRREMMANNVGQLDDGELSELETIDDKIDYELQNFADKADSYAEVLRKLDANATQCKEEIKRLRERQASWERQYEYLKSRMFYAMKSLGMEKHKTALNTFYKKTSYNVEIKVDVDSLDDKYKRIKNIIEADRVLLKEELQKGVIINGVFLNKKESLAIR